MMSLLLTLLAQVDAPADAAGTWADPARSVLLVPGARSLLSGLTPATLDGLQPAASPPSFDGVTLRFPAHAFFGPSVIAPTWVSGLKVSSAVGSSERGGTLGRTVSLLPRETPTTGWNGSVRADVLALGLSVSGVVAQTGTRVDLGGRFFGLPALAAAALGARALLGDWLVRVQQPIGPGELRLLGLGAENDVALAVSGIPLSARVSSQLADLRWKSDAEGTIETSLSGSVDRLSLAVLGQQTRHDVIGREQALTARLAVRPRVSREVRLSFGADAALRRLITERLSDTAVAAVGSSSAGFTTAAVRRDLGAALTAGLFIEARDDTGPFRWSLGLRGDGWKPIGASPFFSLEPRLAVSRELGASWTVGGSAGVRHQPTTWLVPVPVLDTASWRFGLQQAVVGDLEASFRPAPPHRVSARAFGTALRRSLELSPLDDTFLPELNLSEEDVRRRQGDGWAAGASVSWAFDPSQTVWLRVSYSLIGSWRTLSIARFGRDGLPTSEARVSVPWSFDQTHQLQAASGWRFENGWALAGTLTLQTGAPLAGGFASQEQRPGVDPLRGTPRWVPVDRDQVGRAGAWLRLDVRASKTWRPAPLELELFLDLQNATAWPQPTGSTYGTAPSLSSQPASSPLAGPIPMLGLEARL